MSKAWVKKKLKGDIEEFKRLLDEYVPYDSYQQSAEYSDTPETFWADATHISDSMKKLIEDSIGHKMYDFYWAWDYRGIDHLARHRDPPYKYGKHLRIIANIAIDGEFEYHVWNNDEIVERVRYHQGDIMIVNHVDYEHSGVVISGNKRTLCGYLVLPEITEETNPDSINLRKILK